MKLGCIEGDKRYHCSNKWNTWNCSSADQETRKNGDKNDQQLPMIHHHNNHRHQYCYYYDEDDGRRQEWPAEKSIYR